MAKGKRIDPELAGAVQAMADQGYKRQQIANATGVGEHSYKHYQRYAWLG
jgi:DNA invertase Pin-like site-specific DNA recombinase